MKRPGLMLLLLIAAAVPAPAMAGETVAFTTAAQREALPHVRWKGVVAEFLDPQGSGLGKSIGYLLWREVLTAISDQAGAGVILARAPGARDLVDMLQDDYHVAAVEIARAQQAQMAMWGAVATVGERMFLDSYLTLVPEVRDGELTIELAGRESFGLAARLTRTWFQFDLVETDRERLFVRWVVTRRAGVPLRVEPSDRAEPRARLDKGVALRAVDMTDRWFRVEGPQGGGFVKLDDVEVPPREVSAARRAINLRAGPGTDFRSRATIDLTGRFSVLDQRYREGMGLWYRLSTPDGDGWVAGWLVEPVFSLPAVDFLAGLYRYRAGNHRDAAAAFRRFIEATGPQGSNVNRSAAEQLLGASEMLIAPEAADRRGAQAALAAFDRASRLTPYDPGVYSLRALAGLGADFGRVTPQVFQDVARALALNPQDDSTRSLAESLYIAVNPARSSRPTHPLDADASVRQDFEGLVGRYGLRP